jgi:hypothetical protein
MEALFAFKIATTTMREDDERAARDVPIGR